MRSEHHTPRAFVRPSGVAFVRSSHKQAAAVRSRSKPRLPAAAAAVKGGGLWVGWSVAGWWLWSAASSVLTQGAKGGTQALLFLAAPRCLSLASSCPGRSPQRLLSERPMDDACVGEFGGVLPSYQEGKVHAGRSIVRSQGWAWFGACLAVGLGVWWWSSLITITAQGKHTHTYLLY